MIASETALVDIERGGWWNSVYLRVIVSPKHAVEGLTIEIEDADEHLEVTLDRADTLRLIAALTEGLKLVKQIAAADGQVTSETPSTDLG